MTRKEILHDLFKELGLKPSLKGYHFAKTGLEIALDHPEKLDAMMNDLYPSIADRFVGTNPLRVERSVRWLVENMVDTCPPDVLYKVFGNVISPLKGKPTNSEFFGSLREEILIREGLYNI